ncbi:MAG: hypothetical protein BGO72_16885 [Burkholderiales bacterium 70-64]|nr:MAG: hypothetical protein BGO72_16885 [Burkholderiales bacterium 70-64]
MARHDLHWLLGSLCSLYRLPFDAQLIEQRFPPPYTLATFHEAARALGFRSGEGMQTHAEIRLGERTVMEYLLSPVKKAWHEAGRER